MAARSFTRRTRWSRPLTFSAMAGLASCQGRREASVAHQRLDAGVAAAEASIGLAWIDRVADAEHALQQPPGQVLVVEAAGRLGEGLGGVGAERVGPDVVV